MEAFFKFIECKILTLTEKYIFIVYNQLNIQIIYILIKIQILLLINK